ncbi:hypothetical protein CMMCAS04_06495 [Clavibacter michiganensis subsp. michiganensis]|nr:hypothetical protein CMMCAS04_06495 [Clavibacter michiganensis subsp. michiganensis]
MGSSGSASGTSRTGGFGSTATQPEDAVSTSIQAVTSDPWIRTGPPSASRTAASPGANPITTRTGKPRSSAMRAAATAYCSASPSMGRVVRRSAIRSAECPDRLKGASPTPWLT